MEEKNFLEKAIEDTKKEDVKETAEEETQKPEVSEEDIKLVEKPHVKLEIGDNGAVVHVHNPEGKLRTFREGTDDDSEEDISEGEEVDAEEFEKRVEADEELKAQTKGFFYVGDSTIEEKSDSVNRSKSDEGETKDDAKPESKKAEEEMMVERPEEDIDQTQELSVMDIEALKAQTSKMRAELDEAPEADDYDDEEYEDDDEYDDYYDEDYENDERGTLFTRIIIGILVLLTAALIGLGIYIVSDVVHSTDGGSTTSTEVPMLTTSPDVTDEAEKDEVFTSYQTEQVKTAVKNKLKELYDTNEYVEPNRVDIAIEGTDVNYPTAKFTLKMIDGSSKSATMKLAYVESTKTYTVTDMNIDGKNETQLKAEKGTNATATPNPDAPTPSATSETSSEPVLKSSYPVSVTSSVQVTLEIDGDGEAYVVAEKSDGTSSIEVARQDYSGGGVTTTSLPEGDYTLKLYASPSCSYTWAYTTD